MAIGNLGLGLGGRRPFHPNATYFSFLIVIAMFMVILPPIFFIKSDVVLLQKFGGR